MRRARSSTLTSFQPASTSTYPRSTSSPDGASEVGSDKKPGEDPRPDGAKWDTGEPTARDQSTSHFWDFESELGELGMMEFLQGQPHDLSWLNS